MGENAEGDSQVEEDDEVDHQEETEVLEVFLVRGCLAEGVDQFLLGGFPRGHF